MQVNMEYASIKTLAMKYNFSEYKMRKALDDLELVHNEHFVVIRGEHRFHVRKIHDLLTDIKEIEISNNVLSRLAV